MDQRISGGPQRRVSFACSALYWRDADRSHHGKREHNEKHGGASHARSGFRCDRVRAVFCGLKTVFDDQRWPSTLPGGDVRSGRHQVEKKARSPSAISADQKTARPKAGVVDRSQTRRGRPVRNRPSHAAVHPWFPRQRTNAARPKDQALARSPGGSGNRRLPVPGAEMMVGGNAKHVTLACTAQRPLDVANAIDAIGGDPGERRARRQSALDHGQRKCWLVAKLARPAHAPRSSGLYRRSNSWADKTPGR